MHALNRFNSEKVQKGAEQRPVAMVSTQHYARTPHTSPHQKVCILESAPKRDFLKKKVRYLIIKYMMTCFFPKAIFIS